MTTPIKPTDRFQQLSGADQLEVRGIKLNKNAYAQNQVVLTITSEGKSITVRSTNVDVYEFLKGNDAHKAAAETWLKEECLGIIRALNEPNVKSVSKTANTVKVELQSGVSHKHSFENMSGLKVESLADHSFIQQTTDTLQSNIGEKQVKLKEVTDSLRKTPVIRIVTRTRLYAEKKSLESTISQMQSEITRFKTQHTTAKVAILSRKALPPAAPMVTITPEKDKAINDYFIGLSADHLKKLDLTNLTKSQIKSIPFGHLLFDSKLIEAVPWKTLFSPPENIKALPLRAFVAQAKGPSQNELGTRLSTLIKHGEIDIKELPWNSLSEPEINQLLSSLDYDIIGPKVTLEIAQFFDSVSSVQKNPNIIVESLIAQVKQLTLSNKPEDLKKFIQILMEVNQNPKYSKFKSYFNDAVQKYIINAYDQTNLVLINTIQIKEKIAKGIIGVLNNTIDDDKFKNFASELFFIVKYFPSKEAFDNFKKAVLIVCDRLIDESDEYKDFLTRCNFIDHEAQRESISLIFHPHRDDPIEQFKVDFNRQQLIVYQNGLEEFMSAVNMKDSYSLSSPTGVTVDPTVDATLNYFKGLFNHKSELLKDLTEFISQSTDNQISTNKILLGPLENHFSQTSQRQYFIFKRGDELVIGNYFLSSDRHIDSDTNDTTHHNGVVYYREVVLDLTKVDSASRLNDLIDPAKTRDQIIPITYDEFNGMDSTAISGAGATVHAAVAKSLDRGEDDFNPHFESLRLKIILAAVDSGGQPYALQEHSLKNLYHVLFAPNALNGTIKPQAEDLRRKIVELSKAHDPANLLKLSKFMKEYLDFSKANNFNNRQAAFDAFMDKIETDGTFRVKINALIS